MEFSYTVILSKTKQFGPTDLGQIGIDNFFAHHTCGKRYEPCIADRDQRQKLEQDENLLTRAVESATWTSQKGVLQGPLAIQLGALEHCVWLLLEDLANNIAQPMGVPAAPNNATGHFGRIGHNGVTLIGTPASAQIARELGQ